MDFHKAFQEIDADDSGEITQDELVRYMKRMNYTESFVTKWLNLFDIDHDGQITYDEYCTTLGLVPKKEVIEQARRASVVAATQKPPRGEGGSITPQKASPAHGALKATSKTTSEENAGKSSPAKKRVKLPRNYEICPGVMRHSKARVIEKKALYRHAKRGHSLKCAPAGPSAAARETTLATITKPVGGDNNGGTRETLLQRQPSAYPVQARKRKLTLRRKLLFSEHKRRLRPSLQPGTVLILLVGRHRGKRVVFLRQLKTGLLLVTGPLKLNGCPLRRVHQRYVIATGTRLEVGGVDLPRRLNDAYFRRRATTSRSGRRRREPAAMMGKAGSSLFADSEGLKYAVTEERKVDQAAVDRQIVEEIRKRPDRKVFTDYLRSQFSLGKSDYPHKMIF